MTGGGPGSSSPVPVPPNSARRWASYGHLASLLGLGLILWAMLGPFPNREVFIGLLTGGVMLAFISQILALVSRSRARTFEAAVAGPRHLAAWACDPETWQRYVERYRQQEQRSSWRAMRWVVIGLLALALVVNRAVAPPRGPVLGWFAAGLAALLALIFGLVAMVPYRQLTRGSGTVFVGRDGLVLSGTLHDWTTSGARLEEVSHWEGGDDAEIRVRYSTPSQYGRMQQRVAVPVPAERRSDVERVLAELSAAIPAAGSGPGPGQRNDLADKPRRRP